MSNIYYKIVRNEDGKYMSFVKHYSIGRVEYKVDEFVKPLFGYGPLAVFDSLERVKNFLLHEALCGSNIRNVLVFSCEIVESTENNLHSENITYRGNLPNGTILADFVKLLEIVYSVSTAHKSVYRKENS